MNNRGESELAEARRLGGPGSGPRPGQGKGQTKGGHGAKAGSRPTPSAPAHGAKATKNPDDETHHSRPPRAEAPYQPKDAGPGWTHPLQQRQSADGTPEPVAEKGYYPNGTKESGDHPYTVTDSAGKDVAHYDDFATAQHAADDLAGKGSTAHIRDNTGANGAGSFYTQVPQTPEVKSAWLDALSRGTPSTLHEMAVRCGACGTDLRLHDRRYRGLCADCFGRRC